MKATNLEQLVVLLVEPSVTQRNIIGGFLTDSAIHHLDSVENGEEALQAMEYQIPTLVISAMYLPDMTGVELIETMRSRENLRDIAFILISSETKIAYLDPIRQAGAVAILPKPFEYEQLKKALAATVDFIEPEQLQLDNYKPQDISVLLVDDSRFSRHHLLKTLHNLGIQNITEAENGKAAIPLLEQSDFDLILTDYNMPEMDGKELITIIRAMEKFARTPILMVTSESDMSRLAAVDQIGVSAIVDKPFEPDTIRNLIQRVMA
jgi:two-component system chemotaxis response regulator CheY